MNGLYGPNKDGGMAMVDDPLERITIRIRKSTLEKIETLVKRHNYRNVSDFIRKAIAEYLEIKHPTEGAPKIILTVSPRFLESLRRIMKIDGLEDDEKAFIIRVVSTYISNRMEKLTTVYTQDNLIIMYEVLKNLKEEIDKEIADEAKEKIYNVAKE